MRVVINPHVGGFNLSTEAMERLFAIGWRAPNYRFKTEPYLVNCPCRWFAPDGTEYDADSIPFRSHPDLITIVDELGDRAHPTSDALVVVDIPDGIDVDIAVDDCGIEWVFEKHRTWGGQ